MIVCMIIGGDLVCSFLFVLVFCLVEKMVVDY